MQLIKYENEEIRLNSMLDESAFAKTRYESVINQQGLLFTCDSYENHKYHFAYKSFSFDDIRSYDVENTDSPRVFYCGKIGGFDSNSKSLLEFFEQAGKADSTKEDKDKMFEASFVVVSIITQVAVQKLSLPRIGGGGIFINLAEDKTQVLFMPEVLFTSASAALPKIEDANNNGCWINSTLYDLPALCYARSVIAYKMLTGRFPFPNVNLDERNADILDKKFLPMELSVNGINPDLAMEINKGLTLITSAVNVPGKKQKGKTNEDLRPTADFPLESLYAVKSQKLESKLSAEEFEQKAESYTKSQSSKVATKRAIRRNTTKIILGTIAAIIFAIIMINVHNNNQKQFTSKGLTSTQVIQGYFHGVNTKDSLLMQNFSSGKSPQRMQKIVSQIYVLDKQRKVYDADNGYASPQNWIFFITDEAKLKRSGVYGATNLKIDGNRETMDISLKTLKDNPEPLKIEKDVVLKNGMKSVHQVEYFVLHSEGEDNIVQVDYSTDIFTLTYKKDRWIITDIENKSENVKINYVQFVRDYFEILKMTDGDRARTVNFLYGRYPWLPDGDAVQKEIDFQASEEAEFLKQFGLN